MRVQASTSGSVNRSDIFVRDVAQPFSEHYSLLHTHLRFDGLALYVYEKIVYTLAYVWPVVGSYGTFAKSTTGSFADTFVRLCSRATCCRHWWYSVHS